MERGFVINGKTRGKKYGMIVMNPTIIRKSENKTEEMEGCLSEP
jgi:peptide deformylase